MRPEVTNRFASDLMVAKWAPLLSAALSLCCILWWLGNRIEQIFFGLPLERIYVDSDSYISYKAVNFKRDQLPTFVILGGSVARESTLLDEDFAAYFAEHYGREIRFVNLGGSKQSIFQSLAVATTIDLPPGSVVFMHTAFKKFIYSENDLQEEYFRPKTVGLDYQQVSDFVGFSDRWFRAMMPDVLLYRNPINYFAEYRKCEWTDLLNPDSKCYRELTVERHFYTEPMSLPDKERYVKLLKYRKYSLFLQNYPYSMRVYKKLHDSLQKKGVETIFIDIPTSPAEKELNAEVHGNTAYPELTKELSAMATYLDWMNSDGYMESDFYDSQHMIMSGKRKFTAALADYIYQRYFTGKKDG